MLGFQPAGPGARGGPCQKPWSKSEVWRGFPWTRVANRGNRSSPGLLVAVRIPMNLLCLSARVAVEWGLGLSGPVGFGGAEWGWPHHRQPAPGNGPGLGTAAHRDKVGVAPDAKFWVLNPLVQNGTW